LSFRQPNICSTGPVFPHFGQVFSPPFDTTRAHESRDTSVQGRSRERAGSGHSTRF
jgi:hypothetical protein